MASGSLALVMVTGWTQKACIGMPVSRVMVSPGWKSRPQPRQ